MRALHALCYAPPLALLAQSVRGAALAGLCALGCSGCVGGKLDPGVAPAVGVIEQVACTLLPLAVGGTTVGTVCSDVEPIVNAVLSGLASGAFAAKACKLAPITDGRRGLGVVCESYAPIVNRALVAAAELGKAGRK